jgi:hypothetical protein
LRRRCASRNDIPFFVIASKAKQSRPISARRPEIASLSLATTIELDGGQWRVAVRSTRPAELKERSGR